MSPELWFLSNTTGSIKLASPVGDVSNTPHTSRASPGTADDDAEPVDDALVDGELDDDAVAEVDSDAPPTTPATR